MDAPRRNPIGEGERFGNLDVHEVIGRGAFSTVYRATDTLLRRPVALKVVDTATVEDKARELGHTWLELACLRLGHRAGLPPDDPAARSIERILRERNPAEPDRAASYLNPWLPGGGTR